MIRATVTGDGALVERLAALPATLKEGLGQRLADFGAALQESVAGDWLSGRALQRRSGALADSLELRDEGDPRGPRLALAATAPYAAFQEYGFSGTESVLAHLRTIRQAFGRPLKSGAREILVRAYARQVDYPAHSFLGAALDAMAVDLDASLQDGLDETLKESAP